MAKPSGTEFLKYVLDHINDTYKSLERPRIERMSHFTCSIILSQEVARAEIKHINLSRYRDTKTFIDREQQLIQINP